MKILYLITRAERGGAQVHVLDLLQGLHDQCELELATGEHGFLVEQAEQLGITTHLVPSLVHPIRLAADFRALMAIREIIRERRPHLVHAHTSKAGTLGRVAASLSGIPSVYTAHTWCFAEGTAWHWKAIGTPLERLGGALGKRIINVSEANRQLAIEHRVAPLERLVTIHNGVPDVPRNGVARRPAEPPRIVMVARFAPQKDQPLLLEALSGVRFPYRLQFVGDGPLRVEVEAQAARLNLAGQVDFLGERSDISHILAEASLFVLATNWEGFPLSILEAMRAGLPVIASNVGGVSESVVNGGNGLLVPRGDVGALRAAVQQLLVDAPLRERMGAASRQSFEERFEVTVMLRKTLHLYQELVLSPATDPGLAWQSESPESRNWRLPQ